VRVEKAGDLIFMTYYMVDWNSAEQEHSEMTCAQCGGRMNRVEPIVDAAGRKFDGYVCHVDKRVIWAKAD
jgi:hypothetical protein